MLLSGLADLGFCAYLMSVSIPRSQYYTTSPYAFQAQMPATYVDWNVVGAQPAVTAVQVSPPVTVAPAVQVSPAAPVLLQPQPAAHTEAVTTVKAAWEKYFGAFITKDVSQAVACYDETSHVRTFNNISGAKNEYIGLDSVRRMYEDLFNDLAIDLTDFSTFEVNVADVDEDAGQVFMAWSCPGSGILAATSTFIYARNFKIWKQNTVMSKTVRPGQPSAAASLPAGTPIRVSSATPSIVGAPASAPSTSVPGVAAFAPGAPALAPTSPVEPGQVALPSINITPSVSVTVHDPVPFQALSGPALESAMQELRKMQAAA